MTEASLNSRPAVVLIANDQEWSARSLDSILSPQGYTVIRAYTGLQALDRARTARPDLVILDSQLPDIHGLEVCKQLRSDPRFGMTTPIIITTAGPSGRAQRLSAYEAGAWEFYGQPLDGVALLSRLNTFLAVKRETDELREAALIDSRTGLYTVRGLAVRVREIGSEVARRGRPMACIALTLAQSESESVAPAEAPTLQELLRAHGRASDAIAQLGHKEYLVVAPETEEEGALQLVHRLEAALQQDGNATELLAGYSVVNDLRNTSLEPGALLDRATTALRYLLGHPTPARVLSFEALPAPALKS